jgi:hypothetical protein
MTDGSSWRCPICGALAESGSEHLRSVHGIGRSTEDRFGLRQAVPTSNPAAADPRPSLPRPIAPPSSPRFRRRRTSEPAEDADVAPARPMPLPADAAVLRLLCDELAGLDVVTLQGRLADLPGVESAAVDLYDRTIDLFLDRQRATPSHLIALATERLGVPVLSAELHRSPPTGARLGDDTRLAILR